MDVNKLVRMANQIAVNLDYGKDKEKAVAATADHLQRFWTPDMCRAIIAHQRGDSDAADVVELSPLAAAAVARLAELRHKAVA